MGRLALTHVTNTPTSTPTDTSQTIIPLDLAGVLPKSSEYDTYRIRIFDLPARARLSAGCNNGDQSWTLRPDHLPGLDYFVPAGSLPDHKLELRVIGLFGDDEATVIGQFDLAVTADGRTPTIIEGGFGECSSNRLDFGALRRRLGRGMSPAAATEWALLGITRAPRPAAPAVATVTDTAAHSQSAEIDRATLERIVAQCGAKLAAIERRDGDDTTPALRRFAAVA